MAALVSELVFAGMVTNFIQKILILTAYGIGEEDRAISYSFLKFLLRRTDDETVRRTLLADPTVYMVMDKRLVYSLPDMGWQSETEPMAH